MRDPAGFWLSSSSVFRQENLLKMNTHHCRPIRHIQNQRKRRCTSCRRKVSRGHVRLRISWSSSQVSVMCSDHIFWSGYCAILVTVTVQPLFMLSSWWFVILYLLLFRVSDPWWGEGNPSPFEPDGEAIRTSLHWDGGWGRCQQSSGEAPAVPRSTLCWRFVFLTRSFWHVLAGNSRMEMINMMVAGFHLVATEPLNRARFKSTNAHAPLCVCSVWSDKQWCWSHPEESQPDRSWWRGGATQRSPLHQQWGRHHPVLFRWTAFKALLS